MTLAYLAALIEKYNDTTGFCHSYVLIDTPEADVREALGRHGPFDMVWFTINTAVAIATYAVCRELTRSGITTVLGGIHASTLPEEAAHFATTVATGEGEGAVGLILKDWDDHHELAPRYDGGRSPELSALPEPLWEKLGFNPLILPMQTSRGCTNACAFCSTTRFQGSRRRHRPIHEIVEEIQRHRDAGRLEGTTIFFTDNNIVSDSNHRRGIRDTRYARQLFEALIPLGISWAGQGEVNLADDTELVELAALSGCQTLLVGFESLDQANLADVQKPSNTVDRYAGQIETLHRWGISLIGCFIFGLDHDKPAVFGATHRFIQKHIDTPQLSIMTPFPGTALFKRLNREGRILHRDWSQYDITKVTFRPKNMTAEELESGFADLGRRTFRFPSILARAARFASSVRSGPALEEKWISRMARVLAANLYYRKITTQSCPAGKVVANSVNGHIPAVLSFPPTPQVLVGRMEKAGRIPAVSEFRT
jgi:radical SAM superfamily enzyme YgiQ (UPF0313 family)